MILQLTSDEAEPRCNINLLTVAKLCSTPLVETPQPKYVKRTAFYGMVLLGMMRLHVVKACTQESLLLALVVW